MEGHSEEDVQQQCCHARFQEWEQAGFFRELWKAGLMEYDEVLGIDWEWQSVDGAMTKSPFGGAATGGNPTDRGKVGVKRRLPTDADGIPLALFVDGANRHDSKLLRLTVDATVITRPKPSRRRLQHLCSTRATTIRSSMMLLRIADTSAISAAAERHPARRSVEKERAVGLSSPRTVGSTVPDDYSFGGKRRLRELRSFSRTRVCATHLFQARSRLRISSNYVAVVWRKRCG
jgi:hypothetical protein